MCANTAAINFLHTDYDILVLFLHNYTLCLYLYLIYKVIIRSCHLEICILF